MVPVKGHRLRPVQRHRLPGAAIGLYEVMEVTDEVRELILVGASGLELRRKAVDEGMLTLRQSGLRKIKDGVTTVEEVLRETVA